METIYSLEFNEKQQAFHLNDGSKESNTFNWVTILESCSTLETRIFYAYIDIEKKEKLTTQYLLKCASDVKKFVNNLLKDELQIIEN